MSSISSKMGRGLSILVLALAFSTIEAFLGPRVPRRSSSFVRMSCENFDALLFDCDGVIAETERDVHRL